MNRLLKLGGVFFFILLAGILFTSPLYAENDFRVVLLANRKLTTPADLNTLEGVARLREELGLEVKVLELTDLSEYHDQVQAVSEEGYDVVYFLYDVFLKAVQDIAPRYPNTKYIGLWVQIPEKNKQQNVKGLSFLPKEGAFLAGIIAAETSKTKKIGFIGGGIAPGQLQLLAGFEAGIEYSGLDVNLTVTWANTFEDPFKGRELALSLYNRGIDVIFQVANQTGLGVINAAKEVDKYVIGVDVDQSPLAPGNVIASALMDHGYATYDSVKKAYEGNFTPDQVFYGIHEGMPVIAIPDEISADLRAKVAAAEAEILADNIDIPFTTDTR